MIYDMKTPEYELGFRHGREYERTIGRGGEQSMLYVAAGSYTQAQRYAQETGLRWYEWVYIDSPYRLIGTWRPLVVCYGTYYRHVRWPELRRVMREREARVIEA